MYDSKRCQEISRHHVMQHWALHLNYPNRLIRIGTICPETCRYHVVQDDLNFSKLHQDLIPPHQDVRWRTYVRANRLLARLLHQGRFAVATRANLLDLAVAWLEHGLASCLAVSLPRCLAVSPLGCSAASLLRYLDPCLPGWLAGCLPACLPACLLAWMYCMLLQMYISGHGRSCCLPLHSLTF